MNEPTVVSEPVVVPGNTRGRIDAVCRVAELRPDPGAVGVTAIHKRPVEGPVKVGEYGLYGDVQADRAHHGGPDKAVYLYAQEAADAWAEDLGRVPEPGEFGENLRMSGFLVDDLEIGQQFVIGDGADHVVLEVTQPRTPCATFQRYLDEERWVKRFTQRGLSGAYTRVVRRGSLRAGDGIRVLPVVGHGVTVRSWFTDPNPSSARALHDAVESGAFEPSAPVRELMERFLLPRGNKVRS